MKILTPDVFEININCISLLSPFAKIILRFSSVPQQLNPKESRPVTQEA